jgi:hypothetical protein
MRCMQTHRLGWAMICLAADELASASSLPASCQRGQLQRSKLQRGDSSELSRRIILGSIARA